MAARQLAKIDPVRGRGVEYERVWRVHDFARATVLYAQHSEWPDRTHRQHAQMLTRQGHFNEARKSLARIKNLVARKAASVALASKING